MQEKLELQKKNAKKTSLYFLLPTHLFLCECVKIAKLLASGRQLLTFATQLQFGIRICVVVVGQCWLLLAGAKIGRRRGIVVVVADFI